MTAAIIALAAVAAALTAALLACGWQLLAAARALEPERARTAAALLERDQARVRLAEHLAANQTLARRVTELELELDAANQEAADEAADRVRAADDPLAEVNRVLAEPLLPADAATAARRDGGVADAVRSAAPRGDAAGAVGGARP